MVSSAVLAFEDWKLPKNAGIDQVFCQKFGGNLKELYVLPDLDLLYPYFFCNFSLFSVKTNYLLQSFLQNPRETEQ